MWPADRTNRVRKPDKIEQPQLIDIRRSTATAATATHLHATPATAAATKATATTTTTTTLVMYIKAYLCDVRRIALPNGSGRFPRG